MFYSQVGFDSLIYKVKLLRPNSTEIWHHTFYIFLSAKCEWNFEPYTKTRWDSNTVIYWEGSCIISFLICAFMGEHMRLLVNKLANSEEKTENFITTHWTYSFLQSFPFSCFPSGNSELFVMSFVDPSSCLLPALSLNRWKDSCYLTMKILLRNKSKGNTSIKVDLLKDTHSAIIKHKSINIIKKN